MPIKGYLHRLLQEHDIGGKSKRGTKRFAKRVLTRETALGVLEFANRDRSRFYSDVLSPHSHASFGDIFEERKSRRRKRRR